MPERESWMPGYELYTAREKLSALVPALRSTGQRLRGATRNDSLHMGHRGKNHG